MPKGAQDHLTQYEHEVEAARRKFIPSLVVSFVCSFAAYMCYAINTGRKEHLTIRMWDAYDPAFFIGGVILAIIAMNSLLYAIGAGYKLFTQRGFRNTASRYSQTVHDRAVNAYNNVKEFLTSPTEQYWRPSLLDRLCKRYGELERIETREIERQLETAGVWNTSVKWYGKGRTLDEALMLAVYTSRQSKEEAESKAVERSYAQTETEKKRAADLQKRRELELEIAAKQRELARLSNQSPESMPESVKTERPAKETGLEDY